jgi:hypothetical protein
VQLQVRGDSREDVRSRARVCHARTE